MSRLVDYRVDFFIIEKVYDSDRYLQATVEKRGRIGKDTYMVEIREPTLGSFRQMRMLTKDFHDVEGAVEKYVNGISPIDKHWKDVTLEINGLDQSLLKM